MKKHISLLLSFILFFPKLQILSQSSPYFPGSDPSYLFVSKSISFQANSLTPIRTGIKVQKDWYVYFEVIGEVSLGSWAGKITGDGAFIDPSLGLGLYNKYDDCSHGAIVMKVGDSSEKYCAIRMFDVLINILSCTLPKQRNSCIIELVKNPNAAIDEALYDYLAKNDMRPFLPGNYFIAENDGELILDINDSDVKNNTGNFIVNIYVIPFDSHISRNIFNNCPYYEPKETNNTYLDCNSDEWIDESVLSWYYHGYNDAFRGINKYIGCQCVYDSDELLLNHPNEGSFDIGFWLEKNRDSNEAKHKHLILDVLPHDLYVKKYGKEKAKYKPTINIFCQKQSTLFLFDLSGSMNENGANASISKLQQAKNASKQTLNALKNNTSGSTPEVAVLGFSGGCVPDPTIVISNFETNLSIVESRIDAMGAGGGTPLAEAIAASECKLANHLAQTGQDKGKLIVLSDGQATCQQIRPAGTYNSGQLGQRVISVSASQCGNSNYKIKYYTIGFNISAGSPAERDLQYLAQISGGKYLNVQSQTQLERAFFKFNRTYIPKPVPSLSNLPSGSVITFDNGVNQINTESFLTALKTCDEYSKLHPDDCNGMYNLALMQEANDFYKNAIASYQKYLNLCPNAPDREFVEKQIVFLEEEFRQFTLFQKEVIKSDLEYLKLHFEKIQNGESVALAEEFKGFLREKGDYYKNLPELMGRGSDRLFKKNCQEVATGLDNCAKTINRNPNTWDRDATPSLSMTYLSLERLLDTF